MRPPSPRAGHCMRRARRRAHPVQRENALLGGDHAQRMRHIHVAPVVHRQPRAHRLQREHRQRVRHACAPRRADPSDGQQSAPAVPSGACHHASPGRCASGADADAACGRWPRRHCAAAAAASLLSSSLSEAPAGLGRGTYWGPLRAATALRPWLHPCADCCQHTLIFCHTLRLPRRAQTGLRPCSARTRAKAGLRACHGARERGSDAAGPLGRAARVASAQHALVQVECRQLNRLAGHGAQDVCAALAREQTASAETDDPAMVCDFLLTILTLLSKSFTANRFAAMLPVSPAASRPSGADTGRANVTRQTSRCRARAGAPQRRAGARRAGACAACGRAHRLHCRRRRQRRRRAPRSAARSPARAPAAARAAARRHTCAGAQAAGATARLVRHRHACRRAQPRKLPCPALQPHSAAERVPLSSPVAQGGTQSPKHATGMRRVRAARLAGRHHLHPDSLDRRGRGLAQRACPTTPPARAAAACL